MTDDTAQRPFWSQIAYPTSSLITQLAPGAIVVWGFASTISLLTTPIAGLEAAVFSIAAAAGVAYFYVLWSVADCVRVRTQPASAIPTSDLRDHHELVRNRDDE